MFSKIAEKTAFVSQKEKKKKQGAGFCLNESGNGRGRAEQLMETFVLGSLSKGRKPARPLSRVTLRAVKSQYVSKQIILS